jgi:hypothetical protein
VIKPSQSIETAFTAVIAVAMRQNSRGTSSEIYQPLHIHENILVLIISVLQIYTVKL